jgi:hypothetical protein
MKTLGWIRKILGGITLRKELTRKMEILRQDRLNLPPELADLEGVPLDSFMMKRVWSVAGNSYNKLKREELIPEAEEVKRFVGHVLHEDGRPEDPHLFSMPIILSAEKDTLERIVNPFIMLSGIKADEIIRQTWVMTTLKMGWALPVRGGRMDRPPLPWKYLLHDVDYERIIAKNKLAFGLALGFRIPDDYTKRPVEE